MRRWTRLPADQFGQGLGRLAVAGAVQLPNELDDIAAAVAAGEAVPQPAATVDDEGGGVVTAVDGTGSRQPVAASGQASEQAPVRQDLLDGDVGFEVVKVEGTRGVHSSSEP
jgi:hypothetical protein